MSTDHATTTSWPSLNDAIFGRRCWFALICTGTLHYLIAVLAWCTWMRAFGIDRYNYTYYLRDALPALLLLVAYVSCTYHAFQRPRFARWSAVILISLTIGHFVVDNWMHHFTMQMMTSDKGCVWHSPTWWWYEHQCGGWWRG